MENLINDDEFLKCTTTKEAVDGESNEVYCHNFKKHFQKTICQEISNKKILEIMRGPTRRIQNTWQLETVDRELV